MSDYAFQLRVKCYLSSGCDHGQPCVTTITAYDDNWSLSDTHGRIDVEVKHGRAVIFPRGQLHCAVSKACGHSSDGIAAKELVMALVAMHPSDGSGVGDDYFEGYTPEQIAWVEAHGEALNMEREARYCDANGNPRSER